MCWRTVAASCRSERCRWQPDTTPQSPARNGQRRERSPPGAGRRGHFSEATGRPAELRCRPSVRAALLSPCRHRRCRNVPAGPELMGRVVRRMACRVGISPELMSAVDGRAHRPARRDEPMIVRNPGCMIRARRKPCHGPSPCEHRYWSAAVFWEGPCGSDPSVHELRNS